MSQQQFQQQVAQWYELYRTDAADIASHTRQEHDMKLNDLLTSKYLKQEDIDGEVTVTIESLKKQNVAKEDEEAQYKGVMKFEEFEKPLVVNPTNAKRIAKAFGDDTEDWIGKKIKIFVDPDIEFGGKVVGGIRVRTPKPNIPGKPQSDDDVNAKLRAAADDDIPF